MPCNCKTAKRLCDNGFCECFKGGVPCVEACHNEVSHPLGCNGVGGGGVAVMAGGVAVAGAAMTTVDIAVGGGGLPGAANDLIKKFREEMFLFVVISSLSIVYFWGHPFPFLFTIGLLTVFLFLFGSLRHKIFSRPQEMITVLAAVIGVLYVTALFFLDNFRYFVVKDCLEYPVEFTLPSPSVPHPYLESIVMRMINRHIHGEEAIYGIAGPMFHGKTYVVKKLLNGRKHTIFADLTDVKQNNIKSHLIQSFVGNPRNAFLNLMMLDFDSALSTLAQVAMSFSQEEKLVVVIDGAMDLYEDVPSTGKINAPLVKAICTDLSPYAIVLFIFSDLTILRKALFVSHAGGRTRIQLSKPITNNTAMLEWFLQRKETEGLSRAVAEKIVSVLNGNFNDYQEIMFIAGSSKMSMEDALLVLQESTREYLLRKLQLGDRDIARSQDKSVWDVHLLVQRFDAVRRLALDDTDSRDIKDEVVASLVEDNILVPYPNNEITFESNLIKTVAKSVVQEEHIVENVEILRRRMQQSK